MKQENKIGTCEACPAVGELANYKNMMLCVDCYAKEMTAEPTVPEVVDQVPSSDTPIDERLKKAFNDKLNSLVVSDMTPEQIKYHIADQEDMIKILQTKLQATIVYDDEIQAKLSSAEREKLRLDDKKYRAKARPAMNADGTRKTPSRSQAVDKPKPIGDPGTQAFENLLNKMMAVPGMTKEKAMKLLQGGK